MFKICTSIKLQKTALFWTNKPIIIISMLQKYKKYFLFNIKASMHSFKGEIVQIKMNSIFYVTSENMNLQNNKQRQATDDF